LLSKSGFVVQHLSNRARGGETPGGMHKRSRRRTSLLHIFLRTTASLLSCDSSSPGDSNVVASSLSRSQMPETKTAPRSSFPASETTHCQISVCLCQSAHIYGDMMNNI